MKKLYSLFLSVVLAFTASAQTLSPTTKQPVGKTTPSVTQQSRVETRLERPGKAPARIAAQVADIAGDYEVSYTVELKDADPYAGEMTVSPGTTANTLIFNVPFINGTNTLIWNIEASLDPATGKITFSSDQPSGFNGASVVFRHWDNAWNNITEIVATYDGKAIVFDPDDAFGLQAVSGGFYTLFDTIEMTKIVDDPNADPNEGWTSLGDATFTDPWVLPGIGINQHENAYKVELQQNDADRNLYRLVDPYKGNSPAAQYNTSTAKHGYIQFNVSDPEHVVFEAVEAGFANSKLGVSKMYCYNQLGLYVVHFDGEYTPANIVQALGNKIIYTTFKDGKVTLGSREVTDEDENKETEYDAIFGIQGAIAGGYSWIDQNDNPIDMTGSIVFPGTDGIGSIITDADENAPAEYFNMQGQKVANPTAGQILIRRQGNRVDKFIAK